MTDIESLEKGKLLKEALKIVDELATCSFEDDDDLIHCYDDLYDLVKRSKALKRNRFWKLT